MRVKKHSHKINKALTISTNIAGVNYCHSAIAVGESLELIF